MNAFPWQAPAAFLAALVASSLAAGQGAAQAPDIGGEKQLFVDNRLIAHTGTVSRIVNSPAKCEANPIVRPDRPWEGNYLRTDRVIFDERDGWWKMWYWAVSISVEGPAELPQNYTSTYNADEEHIPHYKERDSFTCYAISRDGLHWMKPNLGLVEFHGSKDNNILPVDPRIDGLQTMLRDDHDPDPSRRFKGAGSWLLDSNGNPKQGAAGRANGAALFLSPDGIHPTPFDGNPVIASTGDDDVDFIGWDDRIQKYVGYFRPERDRTEKSYERLSPRAGNDHMRTIAYADSPDFIHWSELQPALVPDEQDPADLQFYHMTAAKYGEFYLGFPWLFRTNRLTMEAGFATSPDGISYTRYKMIFLPLGPRGAWDDCCVYMCAPVARDNRLWFYYGGANWLHSAVDFAEKRAKAGAAIGLATLPLDGFVSMEAGPNPGFILTKPLIFRGRRLLVNLEAAAKGSAGVDEATSLRVELLDAGGNPADGGRSEVMTRTNTRQAVAWDDPHLPEKWEGRPVCLRFQMRNVKIYSFQFVP